METSKRKVQLNGAQKLTGQKYLSIYHSLLITIKRAYI